MATFVPIDPHTDPRWLDFITQHPQGTIFHHPLWFQILETSYRYTPRCRAILEQDKVIGIIPFLEVKSILTGNRGVCMPFSDACAPIVDGEHAGDLVAECSKQLMAEFGWKYAELRGLIDHASALPAAHFKYHVIPLQPDPEKLFRTFRRTSVQQTIGKAIRSGVTIERRNDPAAMEELIRLATLNRKKHGLPPQPAKFFWNVYHTLIAPGQGFLLLAHCDGKVVAAGAFLLFKKSIYYKYTGSDEQYLKVRPYHPMAWEAIKWGCENGYENFDFGRSDPDNGGLLEYKRGWGTVESDVQYVRFSLTPVTPGTEKTTGLQKKLEPLMKKMPAPLLELAGRLLYRHLG
jgi:hypothetical protein